MNNDDDNDDNNAKFTKIFILNIYIIHIISVILIFIFTFTHLEDAFIQRIMEAIKINKRAMICKCYNKSQLD